MWQRARSLWQRGERVTVIRMVLGWTLNWSMLLALHLVFLVYCCEFSAMQVADAPLMLQELLFSWLWSIGQKVIFNDTLIIIAARGLPMLLKSKCCSYICSEGCVEYIGQSIEAGGVVLKELMG